MESTVQSFPLEAGDDGLETVRWKLVVAYDGASFHGFAAQPGVRTVSGLLVEVIARTVRLRTVPKIVCAGRTDAGVHARAQVIHVDLPRGLPLIRTSLGERPMSPAELRRALNRQLGASVVVLDAQVAPLGFDARRSALSRAYRYLIWNSPQADPLLSPIAWHIREPLDLSAMQGAADVFLGEHDFRSFCRRPSKANVEDTIIRRVTLARWTQIADSEVIDALSAVQSVGCVERETKGTSSVATAGSRTNSYLEVSRMLRFDIAAGSFCHQMVRSIVATLVEVGKGNANIATTLTSLRSHSRKSQPSPAPARGLCLVRVDYPSRIEPE